MPASHGRLLAGLLLLAAQTGAARAEDLETVQVTNASESVLCAEKDNVTLNLTSGRVTTFRIEAAHPVYLADGGDHSRAPDWTHCGDLPLQASASAAPRPVVLYEDAEQRLVGYRLDGFWRPKSVPVRVAEDVFADLSLLQLWVSHRGRMEEVLALYPSDGYWRLRPLPADDRDGVYGSSVLIGPVEIAAWPLVDLRSVEFAGGGFRLGLPEAVGPIFASRPSTPSALRSASFSTGPSPAVRSRRFARCSSTKPTPMWPASP
jgi:hypothetical protein